MLWGCSSGLMRDMGDFDRTGTHDSKMVSVSLKSLDPSWVNVRQSKPDPEPDPGSLSLGYD